MSAAISKSTMKAYARLLDPYNSELTFELVPNALDGIGDELMVLSAAIDGALTSTAVYLDLEMIEKMVCGIHQRVEVLRDITRHQADTAFERRRAAKRKKEAAESCRVSQ